MSAMQLAEVVQGFEIFADRDLRSLETARQFRHQNASVAIHKFENGPPAFFVQHDHEVKERSWVWCLRSRSRLQAKPAFEHPFGFCFFFITFAFVCQKHSGGDIHNSQ